MQRAKRPALVLATLVVVLAAATRVESAPAQPKPGAQLPEYDVKAAYLFNFAKFVEWPASKLPPPSTPLRLCIFGTDDPFGDALTALEGKSIREHRLVIERIRRPQQITSCHILFVPRREFRLARSLLEATAGEPVLTVTEAEEDGEPRGIINLIRRGNRIVFQITPQEAERNGLRISSRLLQLAEVYEQTDGEAAR